MATGRVQRIVGETGHAAQAFRLDRGQTKTLVEQRLAHRHGDGQVVRGHHRTENARVRRWQFRIDLRHRATGHQECDALVQRAKQTFQVLTVCGQNIECHQHARSRAWVDDAALMQAVKLVVVLRFLTVRRFGDFCRCCGKYVATQAAASQRGPCSAKPHQHAAALQGGRSVACFWIAVRIFHRAVLQ
ncbi:hypothetical protein ALO75_200087 [Pseudomonas syringae pv. coryli]|uniref:LysR family transcriptional regulator n=1 Tax=Pseudomonas syringae pv. coryli TaxID=317659 RepID=A0A0P9PF37_9PSED|nr:hypothetical protein ALO75_200087 [Pseudomonas syringae pv. coryli]